MSWSCNQSSNSVWNCGPLSERNFTGLPRHLESLSQLLCLISSKTLSLASQNNNQAVHPKSIDTDSKGLDTLDWTKGSISWGGLSLKQSWNLDTMVLMSSVMPCQKYSCYTLDTLVDIYLGTARFLENTFARGWWIKNATGQNTLKKIDIFLSF